MAKHRTHKMNPKSLANLNPPQKPGDPGLNPKGRPAAGAAVAEWLNVMAEWGQTELEAVVDDPNAPSKKVVAARAWLDARSRDRSNGGFPIAGPELDRIFDQTVGKPTQRIDQTVKGLPSFDPRNVLAAAATTEAGKKAAELAAEAMLQVTKKEEEK